MNFVTCPCNHCGGNIEFDQDFNSGLEVDCPHCGCKTLLSDSPLKPATPPPSTRSTLTKCPDCGREVSRRAAACPQCGAPIAPAAPSYPPQEQVFYTPARATAPLKSRAAYVIVGLLLGTLGIHNFYAGHTARALVQLAITIATGWLILPWICVFIWNVVEVCTMDEDGQGRPFV